MKSRSIISATVLVLVAALCAGEVFAAGKGNGRATRGTGTSSATRPADSQRRNTTFLTTGTTANGSTTRPANGRGLQDGSRMTTAQ